MIRIILYTIFVLIFMSGCKSGSKKTEMELPDSLRYEQSQDHEMSTQKPKDKDYESGKKEGKSLSGTMAEEADIIQKIDSMQRSQPAEVTGQAMSNIVKNIASPVEMAALIKSMGVPFTSKHLATTDNPEQIISAYSQAFNLGVYGADLGYINMYQKKSMVLEYVRTIKKLADQLNVGQFFDFALLKELAQNSQNLDSLMYISVRSFNQVDDYLRRNNRSSISAVIISGAWVEGLYLISKIAEGKASGKLKQAIGEQKIILDQLMLILKNFKQEEYMGTLVDELSIIKTEFDKVRITIEVGEPESVVKDGKLTIIQNEKSVIHMSDALLESIISKTENVRNELMKIK